MDREDAITTTTLNDIIQQKLAGIENKIDITGTSEDDDRLKQEVHALLKEHQEIAAMLEEREREL